MKVLCLIIGGVLSAECFCHGAQNSPFIVSDNGAWNIASPKVTFDAVTDVHWRAVKKAMACGRETTNELSTAITHVPEARLWSMTDGIQKIMVGEQDFVVVYTNEWRNREVRISLAAEYTNRIYSVDSAPTGAVPAMITHLFGLKSASNASGCVDQPVEVASPGRIYLARIKYFPISDIQTGTLLHCHSTVSKSYAWLKATVYVSEDRSMVCNIDVCDWNRDVPVRNVGAWAFCYNSDGPRWTASTKDYSREKDECDDEPLLYVDMCVDNRQSVRFYVACDGCEGRVVVENWLVNELFTVIKAFDAQ